MKNFSLVNPLILGQFNTEYKADNGINAISQFWNDLSTHVTNNMPSLYVTLKSSDNQLSHYKISEKIKNGTRITDYTITEFNREMSQKETDTFLEKVEKFKSEMNVKIQRQTGGAKKPSRDRDEDSSSSSESTDDDEYYNFSKYRRMSQPISMWYYTPSIYNVNSVFVPTFNVPIVPYIKIWVPTF